MTVACLFTEKLYAGKSDYQKLHLCCNYIIKNKSLHACLENLFFFFFFCDGTVMFICTWATFIAKKQKTKVLYSVKFYKIFLLSLQSCNIVLKHSTISIYLRLFTSFKDKIHGNKLKPDSENVLLSIISDYHLVGEGTEHTIKGNLRKVCVSDVSANILYELS